MLKFIAQALADDETDTLKVTGVDLCFGENGSTHHTEEFYLMEMSEEDGGRLVVRRGQSFNLKVSCNREYVPDQDLVSLVFTYKSAIFPSYRQNTQVHIPLLSQDEDVGGNRWSAKVQEQDGETLVIQIVTSPTAIIGQWILDIDTKLEDKSSALNYEHPSPIYILFNPWCPEDSTFMDDTEGLAEYVLNDSGLIWRGSHNAMRPRIWVYGQFEKDILDCCLHLLLGVKKIRPKVMSDPVAVSRAITSAVNAKGETGVLVSNWGDDHSDGRSPLKWVGSVRILQEFYETNTPVRYGQCWVFGGIVTTVCRALGIPCRPVTNYNCGRDTEASLTIDRYFNNDGEPIEEFNSDYIWSFHVWNEVWMSRPDLEPGDFGGWQVIDATPQESGRTFKCGPAALKAIRRGDTKRPHDVDFVYAEVNADEAYWKFQGPSHPLKLISTREDRVGKNISTKAVGSIEREDLTLAYKGMEGGLLERLSMKRALSQGKNPLSRYYMNEALDNVEFNLELPESVVIGQNFTVKLTVTNNTDNDHQVKALLRVTSNKYIGKLFRAVMAETFDVAVGAGAAEDITMEVAYDTYVDCLTEQTTFSVTALANVEGTDFDFYGTEDLKINKPEVGIEIEGSLTVGDRFLVRATFTNPLPIPLTGGQFEIEGPGIPGERDIECDGDIAPGEVVTASCLLKARRPGMKTIGVSFECEEMEDVDGFLTVLIERA